MAWNFGDEVQFGRGECHGAMSKIHFYCLAVEVGFYSDVVECLPVDPGFDSELEHVKYFRRASENILPVPAGNRTQVAGSIGKHSTT